MLGVDEVDAQKLEDPARSPRTKERRLAKAKQFAVGGPKSKSKAVASPKKRGSRDYLPSPAPAPSPKQGKNAAWGLLCNMLCGIATNKLGIACCFPLCVCDSTSAALDRLLCLACHAFTWPCSSGVQIDAAA